MTQPGSPLNRSIGFSNLIRGLIAVAAVIAIGAAFAAGRISVALAGIAFLVTAGAAAYWIWRSRQAS
jgi:hypothetical protein